MKKAAPDNGAPPVKIGWRRRILRELPWVLVFAAVYWVVTDRQAPVLKEGSHAGDIRAAVIGEPERILDTASLGDKPLVLVFWAPWCTVCATEMPLIDDLQEDLKGKASVVGVGLSGSDAELREFVAKHKPAFVNVAGGDEVSGRFGIRAFPTIYVLDGERKVSDTLVGVTTPWRIRWAVGRAE